MIRLAVLLVALVIATPALAINDDPTESRSTPTVLEPQPTDQAPAPQPQPQQTVQAPAPQNPASTVPVRVPVYTPPPVYYYVPMRPVFIHHHHFRH
jgi:hypothetical protein